MENKCPNSQENTFFHKVGPNFKIFKEKIIMRAKKNNIKFDEDVFMDTVLKCMKTFSNENATNLDIDNYFWKAFVNNSFSNFSRNKFRDSIDLEQLEDDIIDEEYNKDIDEIVDLIKAEVEREFGSQVYDAWLLHVCNNYSYTKLEQCGYKGLNLHNEFRQIKRHIINKFVRNNKTIQTLLRENNFI